MKKNLRPMAPRINGQSKAPPPPPQERKTSDEVFHPQVRALPPACEGHAVVNVDLRFDWKDRLKVLFGLPARVCVVQPIRVLTTADDKLFLALGNPSCRLVVNRDIIPGRSLPSQPG